MRDFNVRESIVGAGVEERARDDALNGRGGAVLTWTHVIRNIRATADTARPQHGKMHARMDVDMFWTAIVVGRFETDVRARNRRRRTGNGSPLRRLRTAGLIERMGE